VNQSTPPVPGSGAFARALTRVNRWCRSNATAPAILVISSLGLLGIVAATLIARSNPAQVRILPFTVIVVGIAELVAISIGDIKEVGHSGGDERGRRRDDDPWPRPPVVPTGGRGLPAWVGALDGELADEPSVRALTRV
jgi:hypothetical protein